MSEIPDAIRELSDSRERARRAGDFVSADSIREMIRAAGFEVTDTAAGPVLAPGQLAGSETPAPTFFRSEDVPSVLGEPPRSPASIHWVVQGWPEDVDRGIRSVRQANPGGVQQVVVDAAGLSGYEWPQGVEVVQVAPGAGWAAARNAGLLRAAGEIVVLVDGSIEVTGELLQLRNALRDPNVGVTGPFGIVTDDLREFRESDGPEVDAVEGYLMAFRRDLVVAGLRFDEKFKFYRSADIDLSFQIKAMGLRATVTPVPLKRHEHRMWTNTAADERDRLSKRNYYRFLDRWRGRTDLLVSQGEPGSPASGPSQVAPRR